MNYKPSLRLLTIGFALTAVQRLSAKCGNVDYMMLYTLYLIYAVSAIVSIYSVMQIYIKMNVGEEGVTKDIMTLVGACLFMIGASIVFPAFFGYQI